MWRPMCHEDSTTEVFHSWAMTLRHHLDAEEVGIWSCDETSEPALEGYAGGLCSTWPPSPNIRPLPIPCGPPAARDSRWCSRARSKIGSWPSIRRPSARERHRDPCADSGERTIVRLDRAAFRRSRARRRFVGDHLADAQMGWVWHFYRSSPAARTLGTQPRNVGRRGSVRRDPAWPRFQGACVERRRGADLRLESRRRAGTASADFVVRRQRSVRDVLRGVLGGRATRRIETKATTYTGDSVDVVLAASPQFNEHGAVESVLLVAERSVIANVPSGWPSCKTASRISWPAARPSTRRSLRPWLCSARNTVGPAANSGCRSRGPPIQTADQRDLSAANAVHFDHEMAVRGERTDELAVRVWPRCKQSRFPALPLIAVSSGPSWPPNAGCTTPWEFALLTAES